MPRCPAGAMDEGPVDLRTRPKAAGPPGAALPLRKRPLREPSPEPAAPRGAAGPVVGPDPLGGGPDSPAVPAAPHGLARPEALYYQGEWLPRVRARWGSDRAQGHQSQATEIRMQIQGLPRELRNRGDGIQGPKDLGLWGAAREQGLRSRGHGHGNLREQCLPT